jgi:hypothetical protein
MNAKIELFIRMEARGEDHEDILHQIFGITPESTKDERHAAQEMMHRWRHRPDAKAIWDDEIRQVIQRCIPRAVQRISKQIDSKEGWLANKAANDVVNLAKTTSVFQGDDKALTVKIEGMPDIGSPDDDE